MKTKQIVSCGFLAVFIALAFAACNNGSEPPLDVPSATFWAQRLDNDTFYEIEAELLAENSRCEVWVEKGSGVDRTTALAIASEYTNRIYPRITSNFSGPIDLPEIGKFSSSVELAHFVVKEWTGKNYSKLTILLLDIQDGYTIENGAYTAGFFASRDFLSNADVMEIDPAFRSNERAMLYTDVYPGLSDMDEYYRTIAHELQHLMNFAVVMATKEDYPTDTWIDEGLSSAAEYVYAQEHLQQRINWFSADPAGLISKGNNFFVWGNRENENPDAVLDDYATVYLFFQWLRLNGSDNVYKDITFSDKPDHRAVVEAISGYSDWPSLLEGWLKASYFKNYGSDSKLNSEVIVNYAPDGLTTLDLFPGEGVFSVASSYTVPSSTAVINYVGLQSDGTTTTSGSFSGALLTYNQNTNLEGQAVFGTITGVAANITAPGRSSILFMPNNLRGPYAISMGDMIRRRGGNTRTLDISALNSLKSFKGALIGE